ncbi:MAG: nucleotidyltransferase [Bacillales bacterium]|nr:nucleotidyltransferase [Bacillales bacterium]
MEKIGIICEYNPFHYGHKYHINEIKKMYPDSMIILVMSGPFTQRGDASIINKWDKARIALDNNVDLVIELPFVFATQGADIFSHGAIEILKYLKVDKLVFGSESNNIRELKDLAMSALNNKAYDILVKDYLSKGVNYPTALSKALSDLNGTIINTPNDLLGLCYIKEIIKQKANIEPISIKRTNDYHDKELKDFITSATSIREGIKNKQSIVKYLPNNVIEYINNVFIDDYFDLIKYKILTEDISNIQTVDEGIENRIKKYIYVSNSLEELINNVKTKRYTYNKLKRMFLHILCNFTKDEARKNKNVKYIRVLGFNKVGQKYLKEIKKDIGVPIITNYTKENSKLLEIDFRVNSVYSYIFTNALTLTQNEFKNKPITKA